MIADHIAHSEAVGRLGILAFLIGAHFQIMAKCNRTRACMLEKIDQSVGKVWDAGKRAGERRKDLETVSKPLAAVRDLAPRR